MCNHIANGNSSISFLTSLHTQFLPNHGSRSYLYLGKTVMGSKTAFGTAKVFHI